MKKIVFLIIFTLILPTALCVFSCALIEDPPKDDGIRINVYKTDAPPEIDGKTEDGEYKALNVKKTSLSRIAGSEADWSRIKNTNITAYGAVCDGVFYFAVTLPLDEDYYTVDCEPKNMWAQTALLISLAKTGTTGRQALEFGVRPDGESYVWRNYADNDFSAAGNFAAVYENKVLTYEVKIPLSDFGAQNDDTFLFCFSLSVGDYYNGRQAYIQFGRGISGFSSTENADAGKDASLFPTLHIAEEGTPEETETEEQSGHENIPDTSLDIRAASVVCVAVMAAALAAAAAIKVKGKK